MSDTEVVTNEYGLSDADLATERKYARAALAGKPVEEAKPVEAEKPAEETKPAETVEKTTEAKPEGTTPEAKDAVDDPLAKLPEEHRDSVAALLKAEKDRADANEKKWRSDKGRASAYQGKYEEVRRKLSDMENRLAANDKTPQKSIKDSIADPEIKAALELQPDLAELLDAALDARTKELEDRFTQKLRAVAEPLYESHELEALSQFDRELDSKYSNWRQTVFQTDDQGRIATNDKGMPVFSVGWAHFINDQPPDIQKAIVNPTSPRLATWALEQYVEWGNRNSLFATEDKQQQTATAIPNADAIQKKRQEDLKRAAPGKSTAVPLAAAQSEDFGDPNVEARLRRLAREAIRKGDPSIFANR